MSRKKGTPKTGGRQVGTPNRITGTLKEFVENLVDDNREQIIDDLKSLRPRERLAVLERMMQYVLPKQQAVNASVNNLGGCFQIRKTRYLDGKEISEEEYQKKRTRFPNREEDIDMDGDRHDYPHIMSQISLEKV